MRIWSAIRGDRNPGGGGGLMLPIGIGSASQARNGIRIGTTPN